MVNSDGRAVHDRGTIKRVQDAFLPLILDQATGDLAPEGAEIVVRAVARAATADASATVLAGGSERAVRSSLSAKGTLGVYWALEGDILRMSCPTDAASLPRPGYAATGMPIAAPRTS